jgi:hypothetical protein
MLVRAAPGLAHEADGVGVVDHHQGVVFVGEIADPRRLAMKPSMLKTRRRWRSA